MNEKTKELLFKTIADLRDETGKPWGVNPDHYLLFERFAELIVRECALVIHKKVGPKSACNVLEHFGLDGE